MLSCLPSNRSLSPTTDKLSQALRTFLIMRILKKTWGKQLREEPRVEKFNNTAEGGKKTTFVDQANRKFRCMVF